MTKPKTNAYQPTRDGDLAGSDGFRLSFVDGRGILDAVDIEISDAVTVDRLALLIPGLAFPFDITAGVRGLRHRRHLLGRLKITVTAAGVERFILKRLRGSTAVRLWALGLERDHLAFLVRYGPEGARVPLSFRLSPTLIDDQLGFVLNGGRAYGPLPVALLTAAATSVVEMLGLWVEGCEVLPPSIVKQTLMAVLPTRGWRLPSYEQTRLLKLAILPDRIELDFCHPELDDWSGESPFTSDEDDMERLRRQEENHIAGHADRLLTSNRLSDARAAYAKLLDRDPENPFVVARLAMIDVLSPHLRETAVGLVGEAAFTHPERRDLVAVLLHGAALARNEQHEQKLLTSIAGTGNTLENLAVSMRRADLLAVTDPVRAATLYEQALGARRDDERALFAFMRMAAALNDAKRVQQLIPRWIAAHSQSTARAAAHVQVGEILLRQLKDPFEAARHFERAAVSDPDNLRSVWGLAESLKAMGEVERAVSYFERLVRAHKDAGQTREAATALARLADIWLERGERSLTVQRLVASLELEPKHTERRLNLARVLFEMSKPAEAAKEHERALHETQDASSESWWGEAALELATIYLDALGDAAAAKTWAKAAMASPQIRNRAKGLLKGLVGMGESVDELVDSASSPAEVVSLARELRDADYLIQAREALQKGMQRFPENVAIPDELIALCRDTKDYDVLMKTLFERINTVVSPKRRAEMETEVGHLSLKIYDNPATAICWFKSALKKGDFEAAKEGLGLAFAELERQADQLIEAKEYEAARMLFAVVENDEETERKYAAQLARAETAMEHGDFDYAYETAMTAARGSSEARTRASLVAGRALSEQGEKREAVKTLEHTSKSVDEKNAVALILSAIDVSAKDIEDKARARFILEQYLLKHPDDEDADQGVIRLLAITGQRAELAEYLVRKRNAKAYTARLRRAAELFMIDANFDRAADAFEALYRETDAIDDLFFLANALRQAGRYETVIKLLEERQNEDERVQQMLKQDLSTYASMLKEGSLPPGGERAVMRSKPPSLYPEESREILDDTEGLEEKLSSAFSKLRKK